MLAMVPEAGSWTKFEKFLVQELPAVGYITRTRHFHALGGGRLLDELKWHVELAVTCF